MIQIWDGCVLQTVNDVMRQAQLAEKKRSNSVSAAWLWKQPMYKDFLNEQEVHENACVCVVYDLSGGSLT